MEAESRVTNVMMDDRNNNNNKVNISLLNTTLFAFIRAIGSKTIIKAKITKNGLNKI